MSSHELFTELFFCFSVRHPGYHRLPDEFPPRNHPGMPPQSASKMQSSHDRRKAHMMMTSPIMSGPGAQRQRPWYDGIGPSPGPFRLEVCFGNSCCSDIVPLSSYSRLLSSLVFSSVKLSPERRGKGSTISTVYFVAAVVRPRIFKGLRRSMVRTIAEGRGLPPRVRRI
jgi:hypothetical protein